MTPAHSPALMLSLAIGVTDGVQTACLLHFDPLHTLRASSISASASRSSDATANGGTALARMHIPSTCTQTSPVVRHSHHGRHPSGVTGPFVRYKQ